MTSNTMEQLHGTSNISCDLNNAEQLVGNHRLQTQHTTLAMQRNADGKIADIEKNLDDALWKAKLWERECSIRSPHPTKQAADNATEYGNVPFCSAAQPATVNDQRLSDSITVHP